MLAILSSCVATYSLIKTNNLINIHTKIDPSHLTIATSVITIVFAILSWIIVIPVLWLLIAILFAIENRFKDTFRNQKAESFSLWKDIGGRMSVWLSQFAAVFIIVTLLLYSLPFIDWHLAYNPKLSKVVTKVIVWSNYMSNSDECVNHKRDEKVVVINNRKISVAIPNVQEGYTFQVRSCDPEISNSADLPKYSKGI